MDKFIAYIRHLTPVSEAMSEFMKSIFQPDTLRKGSFFIREGEYASEVAFLEEGIVRAFYTDQQGKEYNKTFFEGPATIGSYAALTDCKIWRAKFESIEQFSESNFETERLRRLIAERFFIQNEKNSLRWHCWERESDTGSF